jgi:hypothetical protein
MVSRGILFIHLLIFLMFVGLSLASPFFVWLLPWALVWPWLLGTIAFGVVVVGSWRVWGECPFTLWENAWRKREGRRTYRGACTEHYGPMLGIRLPRGASTPLLECIACIPVIVAVVKIFI